MMNWLLKPSAGQLTVKVVAAGVEAALLGDALMAMVSIC